ncbi:MAG TPA: serine/threonine-protein kinase [Polyangiaceae bacterium]|nr:serine/threonine-protein kinase [Polyangiaceae bacterium]
MGSQSDAARLPERFGPFVLERKLAVGGAAEVFVARPSVGQRPAPRFVIKRPLPGRSKDDDFALLSREAELHQAVQHPNVVQVFGAGMVVGQPYLAMEYVQGVDAFRLLRAVEAERRKLPLGVAVYIGRCIASALASVHSATGEKGPLRLVHGDISPSNIYLSLDGDVKLGDFGIARIAEPPAMDSVATEVKGKWGYVAPEVLEGLPYDHRADLFSLGAVIGELLLGESIFPGSSQLAVLLAIRDANIEPLRRRAAELPKGLFMLLESTLSRDPNRRPGSADELALGLAAFEEMPLPELCATLGQWVEWASDPARLAERIEGRVRESFARMQATRAVVISEQSSDDPPTSKQAPRSTGSHVRRRNGEVLESVPFSQIIEMIATGDLEGDDEVALMGERYRPIDAIEELARHLLPSTTTTTGILFGPGVPDYAAQLDETPMLDILARLRERSETGALFIEQVTTGGPSSVRKEIYLSGGRLHHVASSAREELLGEYLVRRGRITRAQLDAALLELGNYGGRLGDTLVAMRLVEVMDLFRAIRDQGRDRVGQLCAWKQGRVAFYRGSEPGAVQFPLDLDLASAMMSGAILASEGKPDSILPPAWARLIPGPRASAANDKRERGTAPSSLQLVPSLLGSAETLDDAVDMLTSAKTGGRSVNEREAKAALVVAMSLGWIAFET